LILDAHISGGIMSPYVKIALIFLGLLLYSCTRNPSPPVDITTPTIPVIPISNPQATLTPFQPDPTATEIINTPTPLPTETQLPVLERFGPSDFPENVNPLTGLYVPIPENLQRRPVAVKVNIVPRRNNRPPWGLSYADIVYEFFQNAGYSRFHAIFLSQDADLVGPIRSARMFDDALVRMYKSIFSYAGADPKIENRLLNSEYSSRLVREISFRSLCPPTPALPLCRFDPGGNNFLLGGTSQLHEYISNQGVQDSPQNLDGMLFQFEPPNGGSEALEIVTRYSIDMYNRWEYDPETGLYLRFQDNLLLNYGQTEQFVPLIDRLNDQQITSANVVIIFAEHSRIQPLPAEIIEINLTGSGKAYAFRDGEGYELLWQHPKSDDLLYLTFPDGSLYPFKPGITWFQIIGISSQVAQPEVNTWRFVYSFP
jgi:hypothetical protein